MSLDEWLRVGARLLAVDPRRFADVMDLAHQIALAHEDPNAPLLRGLGSGPTFAEPDETSADFD